MPVPLADHAARLAVPLALLAAAVVMDVRARRIPNWLSASLALSALAAAGARGGAFGVGESAAGMAAGVALLCLPFAVGWMGAGDVKLAAAAGGWLGPASAFWLVMGASVLGGIVSLAVWAASPAAERRKVYENLKHLLGAANAGRAAALDISGARRGVPYGVAIATVSAVLIALRI